MSNKNPPGRKRRVPWTALPCGELKTLSEAAEILQIQRSSLRGQLFSIHYPPPDYIETVRDGGHIVGVRRIGGEEIEQL